MLWYNNPEMVEAIRDGRGMSTIAEDNQLMRLVRSDDRDRHHGIRITGDRNGH